MVIIIIIIIICHKLGLDKPVSASSNTLFKVFKVVFDSFVYKSALFLAFCYCSFFSLVVANFSFIFLVSPQLVLLSTLPKFPYSFCGKKKGVPAVLKNLISIDVNNFF
jgi:hypothetical protein